MLSFLSGFYVFGFETLIIRVSGLSLGSSVYTYTIIVASFGLLGMNLPLLFHFLKNQQTHLARTVGSIYALNAY